MLTAEIDPTQIYFTHSKIRNKFTGNHMLLTDTLNQLIQSEISVNEIPIITVYFDGKHYFTQNNRRLWVFKNLIEHFRTTNSSHPYSHLQIPVKIKNIGKKRYSSENASLTATCH